MPWHDYLALALFLTAAAYIARRAYHAIFAPSSAGCSTGCSSCGNSPTAARALLTIDNPNANT